MLCAALYRPVIHNRSSSSYFFFRIGSYTNVYICNGHVAIYFRQFYADKGVKGPKIYPKYGDVW